MTYRSLKKKFICEKLAHNKWIDDRQKLIAKINSAFVPSVKNKKMCTAMEKYSLCGCKLSCTK